MKAYHLKIGRETVVIKSKDTLMHLISILAETGTKRFTEDPRKENEYLDIYCEESVELTFKVIDVILESEYEKIKQEAQK